ncbi:hypothetical protein [Erwinia amylovora]|uniref:hypothetical protein n=1 Tax=Erwinia amylovora TaxID=552 RepID=UPI0002CA659C|nr:hypothetical protein [Erwinia amylovora]CCP05613.1 hypothetical protein BN440_0562 [Erwinia amylovora MR1]
MLPEHRCDIRKTSEAPSTQPGYHARQLDEYALAVAYVADEAVRRLQQKKRSLLMLASIVIAKFSLMMSVRRRGFDDICSPGAG